MPEETEIKIADKVKKRYHIMHGTESSEALNSAKSLQTLAMNAVRGGMQSTAWEKYMGEFASSERQLNRLCGKDSGFIQKPYAEEGLAYMVANGVCGIDTGRNGSLGTFNFVRPEFIAAVDEWDT